MSKAGITGVTADTPKNIPFGAGTIHKNLVYTAPSYSLTEDEALTAGKTYYTRSGTSPNYTYTVVASPTVGSIATYYEATEGWNFDTSIIGATSGGSKLSIVPEVKSIKLDGMRVNAKGMNKKVGETAKMEINFGELSKENIAVAVIGKAGASVDSAYDLIESKADIEAGDYFGNIAFVGETLDGKKIIAILDNALCTSGFELEGKDNENSGSKMTFESNADLNSGVEILPYHIYYPKAV